MPHPDPTQDRLYQDAELAQFYDLDNGWGQDLEYCVKLARNARSVLDLGCGTGQLATRLADGRTVVGVDVAAAMLEIARRRRGGQEVAWVHGDARTVRLGCRFDMVVLTGHAFQVFLSADDQRAVLSTIAAHLAQRGCFVFDTRNPVAQEWRSWTPEESFRRFVHPGLGAIEAWNDANHDAATGIVVYKTHYRVVQSGKTCSASSQIRFTDRAALATMLHDVGLKVDEWLGDWLGAAFEPTSPEIIPVGPAQWPPDRRAG